MYLLTLLTVVAETLEHLKITFLGADEAATKCSEVEHLHQLGGMKAENATPTYWCTFSGMADEVYAIAICPTGVESKLAELFVTFFLWWGDR